MPKRTPQGHVRDAIAGYLKRQSGPAKARDIKAHVLAVLPHTKTSSIQSSLNLHRNFVRVAPGLYRYEEAED